MSATHNRQKCLRLVDSACGRIFGGFKGKSPLKIAGYERKMIGNSGGIFHAGSGSALRVAKGDAADRTLVLNLREQITDGAVRMH